jgi:hypothetical protein
MADLCETPRKLIHKDLRSQDSDILTYKDIGNISRNIHKAHSSQLPPLPTDIEETHETLNAVQVQTSSKQQFFFFFDAEKNIVMFFCKTNLQFLAPMMGFTLTGHSNQHQSFSTKHLQFMDSLRATCIFLTGQ